jgi:chromodomain-helicase-DNA-binding protein 7
MKEETIIEVELTQVQRMLYRSILEDNRDLFQKSFWPNLVNFNNVMMEIRKVCNHPYLLPGFESVCLSHCRSMRRLPDKETCDKDEEYGALVLASGKMILLDKLLPKLKADGHRVLIFSQMTHMLDIAEDYLAYKGCQYEPLDGSCSATDRHESIERFVGEEEAFVFLLSTRAGGLGINLTTADTVII